MRIATALTLRNGDREKLAKIASSRAAEAGLARRARIVLLAAEGLPHTEVAHRAGVSVPVVRHWRSRYRAAGIRALEDLPRSGRPKTVDETRIVVTTLERPREHLGVTHWSSRLLARELGISSASIVETWRKWDLRPWRRQSFKFSTDPQLEAKLTDIIGVYLNPPETAVVVCVDEKSQMHARDRTQSILRIGPGPPEKASLGYIRHDTTSLFAALETAAGQVADACYPRHRHQEFLKFLTMVTAAYPGRELHVVCGNDATHENPKLKAWLRENPRVRLHFTPAGCSWLDLVEVFFSIITRQATGSGTFTSGKDLIARIGELIDGWNDRGEPFVWTKTPAHH
jgi:transposase